jgi:hypothetical protein
LVGTVLPRRAIDHIPRLPIKEHRALFPMGEKMGEKMGGKMGGKMGEDWSQIRDPWLWGGTFRGPSLKVDDFW